MSDIKSSMGACNLDYTMNKTGCFSGRHDGVKDREMHQKNGFNEAIFCGNNDQA
jgi:hypothetical protein